MIRQKEEKILKKHEAASRFSQHSCQLSIKRLVNDGLVNDANILFIEK